MTDESWTSQQPAKPSGSGNRSGEGSSASVYAGAGLQFAIPLLAGLLGGQWLDKRYGTGPWLMLLGMFLGGGAGFYSMYVKLMAAQRRDEEQAKARKAEAAREAAIRRELGEDR
jgi:F0F1-type ATP synthase assembly protein I